MAQRIILDESYLPFGLAVALERDRVGTPNTKFGYNAAVGTGGETLWLQGDNYTWNSAAALELTSGDANDAAAGTGARTVTIEGLDANWAEATETVTMNGQTANAGSTTTTTFLRVNRMFVATAGSGGTNAGVIYASTGTQTAGVPDVATTIRATIGVGVGQTLQAFYSVPADKTLYLFQIWASSAATTASSQIDFRARTNLGPWRIRNRFACQQGSVIARYNFPIAFAAKTDIEMRGTASTGTTDVSGSFEYLLI